MARLQVNIDHVATVRQARGGVEPDPVHAAVLAELGGASGITIHLREDRRHIQDRDLEILRMTVGTRLNLEMAASDEMVAIACRVRPEQVTLVPEKRQELTTEGGLDVAGNLEHVQRAVRLLRGDGRIVSLFIDPDAGQVAAASAAGASAVELHTGRYALARDAEAARRELAELRRAAQAAASGALVVHAGHGLNYQNTAAVAALPGIEDLNIGHSIVARAVLVGLERAVREMVEIIAAGSHP
ncbi:MAG: pyridoxine 5'-phosphate synthase [Planctomycetes bacterium]|nr:pyridoxine 5'-phosphate synthase [Planctomycetota bacterium]